MRAQCQGAGQASRVLAIGGLNKRPGARSVASREEPLDCVLVRSGQEPVVVNLDIAPAEAPEEVRWVDGLHR